MKGTKIYFYPEMNFGFPFIHNRLFTQIIKVEIQLELFNVILYKIKYFAI